MDCSTLLAGEQIIQQPSNWSTVVILRSLRTGAFHMRVVLLSDVESSYVVQKDVSGLCFVKHQRREERTTVIPLYMNDD